MQLIFLSLMEYFCLDYSLRKHTEIVCFVYFLLWVYFNLNFALQFSGYPFLSLYFSLFYISCCYSLQNTNKNDDENPLNVLSWNLLCVFLRDLDSFFLHSLVFIHPFILLFFFVKDSTLFRLIIIIIFFAWFFLSLNIAFCIVVVIAICMQHSGETQERMCKGIQ